MLAYGDSPRRTVPSMAVLGPTGSDLHELHVNATAVPNANEFVVDYPDGGAVQSQIYVGSDFGVFQVSYTYNDIRYMKAGEFIVFSLADGSVRGRSDMPGFQPTQPGWTVRSVVDDRLRVLHSGVPQMTIETVDPASGRIEESAPVGTDTVVLPRGARM